MQFTSHKMIKWASAWYIPVSLSKSCVLHQESPSLSEVYDWPRGSKKRVNSNRDLELLVNIDLGPGAHTDLIVREAFAIILSPHINVPLISLVKQSSDPVVKGMSGLLSRPTWRIPGGG